MTRRLREAIERALRDHQAGHLDSAEADYRDILKRDPSHADALHLLGVLLGQRGRHDEAVATIRQAIALRDTDWAFHSNLANVLQEQGRFDDAAREYRRAIELAPGQVDLYVNLGTALQAARKAEEAAECYRSALRINPHHAIAYYDLANLHREEGRHAEAAACYQQAVDFQPDYLAAHLNRANLALEMAQSEQAICYYDQSLRIAPDQAHCHYGRARALKMLGRAGDALAAFERALAIEPDFVEAHYSRSLLRLQLGDFERGWAEYEWRRRRRGAAALEADIPEWDGSTLGGKTLLVRREGSLDSELFFASFLGDVVAQAKQCIVECDPRLATLYARSFPSATVRPHERDTSRPWLTGSAPIDAQSLLGSLPLHRARGETIVPRCRPYLVADPPRIASWRDRLAALGEGLKVGMSWRISSHADRGMCPEHTLPYWAPLFGLPNVHFVNLQRGDCTRELEFVRQHFKIAVHDWADTDPRHDLDGLAAQLSALDLVILVPNATAHLAGAVGANVWTVLPVVPDWYWMLEGDQSPWYPSMRLFRETRRGGTSELFTRMADELRRQIDLTDCRPQAGCTVAAVAIPARAVQKVDAITTDPNRYAMDAAAPRRMLFPAAREEAFAQARRFYDAGEMQRAEGLYREILFREPKNARALDQLGTLARETGRSELALELLAQAVEIDPGNPFYWFSYSVSLNMAKRSEEAIQALKRALRLHPNFPEAHLNLGALFERLGRYEEAEPYCRQAVELDHESASAHYNLANVLLHTARLEDAWRSYDRTLELDPDHPRAHWNRGLGLLLTGNFQEGWQEYEWREAAEQVRLDHYPVPPWDGLPLAGKTILAHAEQGVGDEVMFGSCLPDLIGIARHVVITCDPRLAALFARSFPTATVHAVERAKSGQWTPPRNIDWRVTIGSLPKYLRPNWESFPRQERFLVPAAARVAHWRRRYEALGTGARIGISWRAGGVASEQRRRTTSLDLWRPLFEVPGVHFVNLQYGDCRDEIADAQNRLGVQIHDWDDADPTADLDDFAAQVAALDLVISVGNTTIHVAGALGVETWVLLPAVPGWRYLLTGEEMPWYRTVRLARHTTSGGWPALFAETADRLGRWMRERVSEQPPQSCVAPRAAVELTHQNDRVRLAAESLKGPEPPTPECSAVSREGRLHILAKLRTANRLVKEGRFDEAVDRYRHIIAARPEVFEAHRDLARALVASGRPDLAIASFDEALGLQGDDAVMRVERAQAALSLGRYSEGWRDWQWRFAAASASVDSVRSACTWNGEPLAGKSITIHDDLRPAEGIMFASCYDDVVGEAACCTIECDRRMTALFRRSFPRARVLSRAAARHSTHADAQVELHVLTSSVPRFVRPNLACFPKRSQHLIADEASRRRWRSSIAPRGEGLTVGLAWGADDDAAKGPRQEDYGQHWRLWLDTPGVRFVSLETATATDQLLSDCHAEVGRRIRQFTEIESTDDWDKLASLVSALDLVIATTNVKAHLAAALGIETWVLVPMAPTWHWMFKRIDHPWYPAMQLIRQATRTDWDSVGERVAQRLHALTQQCRKHGSPHAVLNRGAPLTLGDSTYPRQA